MFQGADLASDLRSKLQQVPGADLGVPKDHMNMGILQIKVSGISLILALRGRILDSYVNVAFRAFGAQIDKGALAAWAYRTLFLLRCSARVLPAERVGPAVYR